MSSPKFDNPIEMAISNYCCGAMIGIYTTIFLGVIMLQLSLWNLPTSSNVGVIASPFTLSPVAQVYALQNFKLAAKFEKLAAGMEKTIEAKLNPPIASQNLTHRRMTIAESMRKDGEKLAVVQNWLKQLAKHHREGTCPTRLAKIANREQLFDFYTIHSWEKRKSGNINTLASAFSHNSEVIVGLKSLGIYSAEQALAALAQLEQLGESKATLSIDPAILAAQRLRQKAIFAKAPDFFPTPVMLIERMLEIVAIEPHHRTLEPSAGGGDICTALRDRGVANIDTFEWNNDLAQSLTLLGFPPLDDDFLRAFPQPIYDRIVMNPPFSKDTYIDHIYHAFRWLAPGGELISVAPSGFTESQIKKRSQFNSWLNDNNAEIHDNPDNSFSKSDRSCGVSTKLIHIVR